MKDGLSLKMKDGAELSLAENDLMDGQAENKECKFVSQGFCKVKRLHCQEFTPLTALIASIRAVFGSVVVIE